MGEPDTTAVDCMAEEITTKDTTAVAVDSMAEGTTVEFSRKDEQYGGTYDSHMTQPGTVPNNKPSAQFRI